MDRTIIHNHASGVDSVMEQLPAHHLNKTKQQILKIMYLMNIHTKANQQHHISH